MARLYFADLPRDLDRKEARAMEHRAGRQLACSVLGCEVSQIRLHANGKPYLPGGPHFSISHCDGLVLLAVSELGEIGCDAERADRMIRNEAALRRKIAAPGEEDIPLLQLWVKKEALYKAGAPGRMYYPVIEGYVAAVCCTAQEELDAPVRV